MWLRLAELSEAVQSEAAVSDAAGAIKPDQQDFEAVEKEYGPLPPARAKRRSTSDID